MKWMVILLFVMLTTGCAVSNVEPDFSLAEAGAKGEGILIGSITTDSLFPHTYGSVDTNVFIGDNTSGPPYLKHLNVTSGCDLKKPGDSDFKDACGRLFAVSLPAGTHYFVGWNALGGGCNCGSNDFPPVSFVIEPGRATYVGNIHIIEYRGTNPRNGIYILEGVSVVSRDEQVRDIPLLEAKYPGITADLIDYQIRPFPQE